VDCKITPSPDAHLWNFVFLPLIFYMMYKRAITQTYIKDSIQKLLCIFGYSGVLFFLTGTIFKIMHWPGSAHLLILFVVVFNLGFLPLLFYRMYKKSVA